MALLGSVQPLDKHLPFATPVTAAATGTRFTVRALRSVCDLMRAMREWVVQLVAGSINCYGDERVLLTLANLRARCYAVAGNR